MKWLCCYIALLLFDISFSSSANAQGCLPTDTNAIVVWYNRVACRGCFIELDQYFSKNNITKEYKIYVGVYYDHITPMQKREVINNIRNELMPSYPYEIFFLTNDECSGIIEQLKDYTPAVSIKQQFYSYDILFKENQLQHSIFEKLIAVGH